MAPDDRWLAAVWPFVREQLPAAPARVLEVGCGTLGGLVPALVDGGYQAVGVDPQAPQGSDYQRVEVEQYKPQQPVDCVVVEWAWERFDEATARWGFARLAPPAPGAEPGWLHKHQQRWSASGRSWDHYLRDWATKERLHPGETILGGLETRFTREHAADAPYLFADLADTSQTEEHDRLRPDPALRPARPHPRHRQCALRPGRGHPPAGGGPHHAPQRGRCRFLTWEAASS
ncbi:MAG: Methyltransferase domain [Actinomycetia bacterium]|nr:Methyltransferase domain [Actinomycetes bacterium]